MIIFDIETGPLPDEVLFARVQPYQPAPPPGEFDPASVKTGNLKDAVKIAEKIEAAKQAHLATTLDHDANERRAAERWRIETREQAPLSALTGQVLAIGYASSDKQAIRSVLDVDAEGQPLAEATMLNEFWQRYLRCRSERRSMVGHNICGFDIPFLMRRSWLLGVEVPTTVLERGKFLDSTFVDTMLVWKGPSSDRFVKLDDLAKAVLGEGKPEGLTGGDFWKLLTSGDDNNRQAAIAYLLNDLRMTLSVANAMGIH